MLFFLSCCSGRGQFIIIAGNFLFSCTFTMAQFSSANEIHGTFTTSHPCSLARFVSYVLRPIGYLVWSYLIDVFESVNFDHLIRKDLGRPRPRICRRQTNWSSSHVPCNMVMLLLLLLLLCSQTRQYTEFCYNGLLRNICTCLKVHF